MMQPYQQVVWIWENHNSSRSRETARPQQQLAIQFKVKSTWIDLSVHDTVRVVPYIIWPALKYWLPKKKEETVSCLCRCIRMTCWCIKIHIQQIHLIFSNIYTTSRVGAEFNVEHSDFLRVIPKNSNGKGKKNGIETRMKLVCFSLSIGGAEPLTPGFSFYADSCAHK